MSSTTMYIHRNYGLYSSVDLSRVAANQYAGDCQICISTPGVDAAAATSSSINIRQSRQPST